MGANSIAIAPIMINEYLTVSVLNILSTVNQHLVQWSEERIGLTFSVNVAKLEPRRIRKNDIPATAELAKAP